MRKILLSTVAMLTAGFAATTLGPSTADAESVVTGCVAANGTVSRLNPSRTTPLTTCPRGSQRVSFQAEVPGTTFLKRQVVLSEPGELVLLQQLPFTLVVTLLEEGSCFLTLEGNPLAMPFQIPGPTGSDIIEPDTVRTLLSTEQNDIAGNLVPQEFISVGRASLLIDDAQLTGVVSDTGMSCRAGVVARFSRPHSLRFTR
jgi:hypothetical protein